jgi:hypothetical protein
MTAYHLLGQRHFLELDLVDAGGGRAQQGRSRKKSGVLHVAEG